MTTHRIHLIATMLLLTQLAVAQAPTTLTNEDETKESIDKLLSLIEDNLLSQPRHARQLAKKLEQFSLQIKDETNQAIALLYIGKSYRIQALDKPALHYLLEASQLFKKLGQLDELGQVHNEIGRVYWQQKKLSQAERHHTLAKQLAQRINNEKLAANSNKHLGILQFYMKHYPEALNYYQEALQIAERLQCKKLLAALYNNIGLVHARMTTSSEQPDYTLVLDYYQKALATSEAISNAQLDAAIYDNIGDIYRMTKEYDKAKMYLEKGLLTAISIQATHRMLESYESLFLLAKAKEDFPKAMSYLQAQIALKDSLTRTSDRIKQTEIVTARQDQEGQLLQQTETLFNKQQEIDQLVLIALSSACLFLICGSAFGLYWYKTKLWKNKQALVAQQEVYETQQALDQQHLEHELLAKHSLEEEMAYKNQQMSSYALNIIQKQQLLEEVKIQMKNIGTKPNTSQIKKLLRTIDQGLSIDQEWKMINESLDQVNVIFFNKLQALCPELTHKELRLCLLAKLDMNTKSTAELLKIAPNSVSVARHRIRKKLQLPHEENLNEFMQRIA